MKWINKGNEPMINAITFSKKWGNNYKFYVFGAGRVGMRVANSFIHFDCLKGFIDNDEKKQKKTIEGYDVISLDEYLKKKDGCIIVCVGKGYRKELMDQLNSKELVQNLDYYLDDFFLGQVFPELLFNFADEVYVRLAQISLTERCTLHCKMCAHGCYAVPNTKEDLQLKTVYESADNFFSIIDYIEEFVLIGGEPFIYKEIGSAIKYIGEKYREKIGVFSITTNGTIIPDDEVMNLCHTYDMTIRISNYERTLPELKNIHEKLQKKLSDHNVTFYLGDAESYWVDYGFGHYDRGADKQTLIKVFDECGTPCREVRGDKYYYCVMARSVAENLKFCVGENDYLNLKEAEENRKVFIEYNQGFSEKGYLDMCNYCHGADVSKYIISAAEQVKTTI